MSPANVLQIIAMAAVWGASFMFLRIAAPGFGPVPLIAIRVAIAALFLLPVLVLRAEWRAQFRQNFGKLLVLGAINAAIPFPLFAYVTLFVTAGFASVINATAPLFAALVARLWLGDRLSASGLLGLGTGFVGVALLVGGLPVMTPHALLAVAGALFAALLYGVAANYVKRYLGGVSTWVTTGGSFGIAALLLAPLAWWQWPAHNPSGRAWLAVLLLAILCTSIPNGYYFRLVLKVGPARAMAVAYLIPVFGMLWGWVFLAEQPRLATLGGCAVILLGTALVTGLIRPRALR